IWNASSCLVSAFYAASGVFEIGQEAAFLENSLAGLGWFRYCSRLLEEINMSRRCEICGKGQVRGNSILRRGQAKKTGGIGKHVTAVTPRVFRPNLQVVRALVGSTHRKIKACANC